MAHPAGNPSVPIRIAGLGEEAAVRLLSWRERRRRRRWSLTVLHLTRLTAGLLRFLPPPLLRDP